MTRNVKLLSLDDETFMRLLGEHPGVVQDAIGYLSIWGMTGYIDVTISWTPRYGELLATYHREGGGHSFTMAGVWREELKKFTFHS